MLVRTIISLFVSLLMLIIGFKFLRLFHKIIFEHTSSNHIIISYQLYPTILYTIQSNNGTLAIRDEHTYWVLEDQVKQLLGLRTAGVLVR